MVKNNNNLHKAKRAKNDEFYTRYDDIEAEIKHYIPHLNDKVIYCNCDTPASNFYKYFNDNFEAFNLKKLIVTGLKDKGGIIYQRTRDNVTEGIFEGDGGYSSPECLEFLKEADIVITNPPFSLFRDYVKTLMDYDKKFLIIGNANAVTNKNIFPYIKNGDIFVRTSNGKTQFAMYFFNENGEEKGVPSVWLTNLDSKHLYKTLELTKTYSPDKYPTYANYPAIEVGCIKDIPMDYKGIMGVPISILLFSHEQFEIVGSPDGVIVPDGWNGFTKEHIDLYHAQGGKGQYSEGNNRAYYLTSDGMVKTVYKRILIKKRRVNFPDNNMLKKED